MGELIAVLSGKGGTGKTSVCAGVAAALAQSGKKVLCIDCDIGLRNLDIALGISELGTISFMDICNGEYDLEQASRHPVFPNLHFLTAPMNVPAESIDPLDVAQMLDRARNHYHYIFLDAPAGIDAGFRLAARVADRVILVTGADPAAIRDARQAADKLELMGKKNVRLVVNRINKKMAAAMNLTVDDVMDRAGLPLLGIVPEDQHVVLAASFRQPLLGYTTRGASAACRRIAKRIEGIRVPVHEV
jgi:septum site-determining protein MinD